MIPKFHHPEMNAGNILMYFCPALFFLWYEEMKSGPCACQLGVVLLSYILVYLALFTVSKNTDAYIYIFF